MNDWTTERQHLITRLREWCGVIPERGPLHIEQLNRREYATHTEIKLAYDGLPGERIPAYLLLPRTGNSARLPAVIAAHQCALQCDIGKEQVVGKCTFLPDQAYGLELVREGFVVLAPDANKVGERYDAQLRQPWETASTNSQGQYCCCCAPGGPWGSIRSKPVFDVMRGVDLLCQHVMVDPARIGMIGHSMGADTIIWAMPFEERIRAAVISGGGLMITKWTPYGLPYADILKLIAPRPFFEVTGAWDTANWKETEKPATVDEAFKNKRQALANAREVYALHGKPDNLAVYEFEGEHTFPTEARQAAYAWLKRTLTA